MWCHIKYVTTKIGVSTSKELAYPYNNLSEKLKEWKEKRYFCTGKTSALGLSLVDHKLQKELFWNISILKCHRIGCTFKLTTNYVQFCYYYLLMFLSLRIF